MLEITSNSKDEYFLNVVEGENDDYESSQMESLIANPMGIFAVYSWREVFEHERFWALGSGTEYALGAMHAAYDLVDNPGRDRQNGYYGELRI